MNEIPISMFEFLVGIQFVLLMYAIIVKSKEPEADRIDHLLTASFSTVLGWLNANMILNGNVNMVQSTGTAYSYIPIQSLPLHYFLLAVAIVSAILVIWLVIDMFRIKTENEEMFTALGGEL